MSDIKFLQDYFSSLKELLNNEIYFEKLIEVKNILKKGNLNGKKTMIFWKWR